MKKLLTTIYQEFRELLFPSRCQLCRQYGRGYLCLKCLESLPKTVTPLYEYHLKVHSLFAYQGTIKELLHRFKYQGFREIGKPLGTLLGKHYQGVLNNDYDLLIPVPLHKQELQTRGFNQALILANGFVSHYPLKLMPEALRKIRKTRSQVGLNLSERKENLKKVFMASQLVKDKRVLLIDDVFTTGETFRACRTTLREAGAKSVEGITLCRQL